MMEKPLQSIFAQYMTPKLLSKPWLWTTATIIPLVALLVYEAFKNAGINEGHFTYPLDDAYIHLAMAMNWVKYGVIGLNGPEYIALSSSPLYTGLVALQIKFFGYWEFHLLVLNIVCAVGLVVESFRLLRLLPIPLAVQAALVLLAFMVSPVHIIVLGGMEHVLQCWLIVGFLARGSAIFLAGEPSQKWEWGTILQLGAWGALSIATRTECVFVVAPFLAWLFLEGRYKTSIGAGIIALVPVVAYGIYNLKMGDYFLPNSIMLKSATEMSLSAMPDKYVFLNDKVNFMLAQSVYKYSVPGLLLALPLLLGLRIQTGESSLGRRYELLAFLASVVLFGTLVHCTFGKIGNNYRYDNYINYINILAVAMSISVGVSGMAKVQKIHLQLLVAAVPVAFLIYIVLGTFKYRFDDSWKVATVGSHNIYVHQKQVGRFFKSFYPSECVVVNDVGVFGIETGSTFYDLSGLASADVLAAMLGHSWNPAKFAQLWQANKRPRVGFVYPHVWRPVIDSSWQACGMLRLDSRENCASDTIAFFAYTDADAAYLRQSLGTFAPTMPQGAHIEMLADRYALLSK